MNFTLDAIQKSIEDQLRNSSWFLYPQRDAGRSYLNTDLSHAVIGLNEEAGEVAGLLKKHVYRNKTRTDEQWIDELGDVSLVSYSCCCYQRFYFGRYLAT